MPATIRYNTLRLAMVLVVGAVCYVLGARGLTLVLLALLISMPLSFVLLARWRKAMIDEFAAGKAGRLNPIRAVGDRIDAANQAEDDAVDRASESDAEGERPTGP